MNWTLAVIVIVFLSALMVTRALGNLREEDALRYLEEGAIVIDVRTEAEFAGKSIDGVVNLPLHKLVDEIEGIVPDKDRVVLLHCRSGSRSGRGAGILKTLGYENAYNLGAFGHASKVLRSASKSTN